ncbi:MAG: L-threonylcarbamoyladenylate synthase [bacterium]|nr:L-threonylcarbamoyladenylate synthase [bacterium]
MKKRVEDKFLVSVLQEGGIAVLPSDTLYGVMTSALREESVERLYQLRGRGDDKPFIVLVHSALLLRDIGLFAPLWSEILFERAWPGPVSFVIPAGNTTPQYLHRGTNTVAVRVPDDADLRELLSKTGPLVAPSANPPGLPPATTAYWAEQYFKNSVDYYFDGGYISGQPSTVAVLGERNLTIVREGAFDVRRLHQLAEGQ